LAVAGCDDAPSNSEHAAADHPGSGPLQPVLIADTQGATSDTWEAIFLQGAKVGYGQTVTRTIDSHGEKIVQTEAASRLTVVRKGDAIEQEIRATSWETPAGELLHFNCELRTGSLPTLIKGTVQGDKLVMQTTTAGKTETSTLPWSKGWGGFQATEQSLQKQPMQPGEKRKLKQFELGLLQIADVELKAIGREPTLLLDHSEDLLRIERTLAMPGGQTMQQLLWTDRSGELLKSRFEAFNNESFRCAKEFALQPGNSGRFDLILNNFVKVDRPIANPHATKRIRYLVQVEGGDPLRLFPAGLTQSLKPLDKGTAELTVRAVRPGAMPERIDKNQLEPEPTEDDRAPNNLVQSDDAKVVALAKQAAGSETDPWIIAQRLEKFVHNYIKKKDFSQGFATAAEVAANPEGDCTEHAVLLAALARAEHIPARCCIGLVYVGSSGFGYHMWTEAWIDGHWIPLDATLGQGGIGAAHLKLASTNLKGVSAFSAFLPVAHVMGKLKVKVLEVE
jgi:hypothetical protein